MSELGNTPADKDYKPSGIVNNLTEGQTKAVQLPDGRLVTEELAKSMINSHKAARKAFPGEIFIHDRCVFRMGYEQATQDIIALVESRISEIIGDAQPKPILRAELEELIKKIKDDQD